MVRTAALARSSVRSFVARVWSALAHCSSADFESTILALGRDNAQLLFNRIFELPTELLPHDVGKLAVLPTGTTPLPREKPVSEGGERDGCRWKGAAG